MCFQTIIDLVCKRKHGRIVPILSKEELVKLFSIPQDNITFLGEQETEIVRTIREETLVLNRNNVSRTKAYLSFYLANKEVHWAFLAHMVSRNGGWNMTDLKGSLLHGFLPTKKVQLIFRFLEEANASIFQDAYAQLLLYKFSKRKGINLSYLLPHLSVSTFMKPIWDYFWITKKSSLLTVALIVNEQNHLQRLVDDPIYENEVLNTVLFKAQQYFGFNDVLFPYIRNSHHTEIAGVTVQHFNDVNERISIGKMLYGILFNKIYEGAISFAKQTPHTGSRSDFWPHLFTKKEHVLKGSKQNRYIFSPTLKQAWPNHPINIQDKGDWFSDQDVLPHLTNYCVLTSYNLSKNYKKDINRLKLITNLKKELT